MDPPDPNIEQKLWQWNFGKGRSRKKRKSLFGKKKKDQEQSSTLSINWIIILSTNPPTVPAWNATAGVDPGEDSPEAGDTNAQYHTNLHNEYPVDNWKKARVIRSLENKLGREHTKRQHVEKQLKSEKSARKKSDAKVKVEREKRILAQKQEESTKKA